MGKSRKKKKKKVGVPHCASVFKVWANKTEIECLPNVHVSANSKISPDHI